jgi:hypothetical protein
MLRHTGTGFQDRMLRYRYREGTPSEQFVAVLFQKALPAIVSRNRTQLAAWWLRPPIGHLQEKQIGELLDIVIIAHTVIAKNVTVIPTLLSNRRRCHPITVPGTLKKMLFFLGLTLEGI